MHIALRTENNRDFAERKIWKWTVWATIAWLFCLMLMGAGEYYQEKTSEAGFFVFFFADFMLRPLFFLSLIFDALLNYVMMSFLGRRMYPPGEMPERPFSDFFLDQDGVRLSSGADEIFMPYTSVSELDLTINTKMSRAVYVVGMDIRLTDEHGEVRDVHIDGDLKLVFKIFDFKKHFRRFVWRINGPVEAVEKTLQFYEKYGRKLYCGDSLAFFLFEAVLFFGIGCFLLILGPPERGDEPVFALQLIFGVLGSIPVFLGLGVGAMAVHDIYVRREVREEDFPKRSAL